MQNSFKFPSSCFSILLMKDLLAIFLALQLDLMLITNLIFCLLFATFFCSLLSFVFLFVLLAFLFLTLTYLNRPLTRFILRLLRQTSVCFDFSSAMTFNKAPYFFDVSYLLFFSWVACQGCQEVCQFS